MKTLLRSCFRVDASDDKELFLRNSQALSESGLSFDVSEDQIIWGWVQEFVSEYRHIPDAGTIKSHFEVTNQFHVVDRVELLSVERARTQGNFLKLMDARMADRRMRLTTEILKQAGNIATSGVTIKEGRKEVHLRGPIHALRYVMDQAHDVVAPSKGMKLSGNVSTDGDAFTSRYERVKNDPLAGLGQFSGIQQMDVALKGAKRKELWTHAAFTGGLKSTLAINWHYNQAVFYRHSSILFSLEMPYEQVCNILYALHTAHPKFEETRKTLGIKKSLAYDKIRDGELSDAGEKFLGIVVDDMNNPENKYGGLYIEVADPDKSDFHMGDLRSKAELLFSKDPSIRLITIDHAGLLQSRHRHNSTTERLNEVIRDGKRMAMSFNRGMGIAVIALFQISREGFKAAEKNGGKYNLTHLSYANEAERSSDIVTASYVDEELRESNLVLMQCLKARDHKPFTSFYAGVLWKCRRIYTTHDVTPDAARAAGKKIDEIDLEL